MSLDRLALVAVGALICGALGGCASDEGASEGAAAGVTREPAEKAPGEQNDAQILPGDAHAQNLFDTDQSEAVTKAILELFSRS